MRFWDSSALVPLFVNERGTTRAEGWLREDPVVIVWASTRVELLSAFARRRREEPGAARRLSAARREMIVAWADWSEITTIEVVRRHAERLVESHPLRAADAFQLGAALVAADGDPTALAFVTFDDAQADAAEREGFHVLTRENDR